MAVRIRGSKRLEVRVLCGCRCYWKINGKGVIDLSSVPTGRICAMHGSTKHPTKGRLPTELELPMKIEARISVEIGLVYQSILGGHKDIIHP